MTSTSTLPATTRRHVEVLSSQISYLEAGDAGPTVLLLHGNPTSSYLWRDVIPHVAEVARCIAPDLIGFGGSGKPDIDYSFADHFAYLEAFIDKLGIDELAFVAQDWGSALAFHHAALRPKSVLGLAFMEFVRPAPTYEDFHRSEAARTLFRGFRTPGEGEKLILEENAFVEGLQRTVIRKLSEEDMQAYRAPFPTPASRKPMLKFPRELPIAGEPADICAMCERDQAALAASRYPKLLFCAEPGALISPEGAAAFAASLNDCRLINLGRGTHNLQEDHPQAIGEAVRDFLVETGIARSPSAQA